MDSIQRNRVGMRYYRGVLGYYYDQIVRFSSHPNNPDELGQFETDWRTELEEMQALDRYVCGECRDEGGGSRLRDFIHHLQVSEWDTELDAVVASGSGSSLRYTARLPRIDRSNPDRLIPHANRNVRTWVSNVASVDGGWRSMMRDFNDAVKRWDRDLESTDAVGLGITPLRSKGEGTLSDTLGRTVKGSAADVVNGVSKTIRPAFKCLSEAVDDWELGGSSTTEVSMLQNAAIRFKTSCDLLANAQRVYAHFPIKDDEDAK